MRREHAWWCVVLLCHHAVAFSASRTGMRVIGSFKPDESDCTSNPSGGFALWEGSDTYYWGDRFALCRVTISPDGDISNFDHTSDNCNGERCDIVVWQYSASLNRIIAVRTGKSDKKVWVVDTALDNVEKTGGGADIQSVGIVGSIVYTYEGDTLEQFDEGDFTRPEARLDMNQVAVDLRPLEYNGSFWFGSTSGYTKVDMSAPLGEIRAEAHKAGCCKQTIMLVPSHEEYIIVGTDTGIAFKLDPMTDEAYDYTFVKAFIKGGWVDRSVEPNVVFFSTSVGIYRMRLDPFEVVDFNIFYGASQIVPVSESVFAFNRLGTTVTMLKQSCDYYRTCEGCVSDEYCGWCGPTQTCQTSEGACLAFAEEEEQCLAPLSRVRPLSGPDGGGSVLTATSVNLPEGTPYFCHFVEDSCTIRYSFEGGLGDWEAVGDMLWLRLCDECTPVPDSGPCVASDGSCFVYARSGTANKDEDGFLRLAGVVSDITSVSFDYYMYGDAVGVLFLEARESGGSWVEVWRRYHDQGEEWHTAFVGFGNLAGYDDLRFGALRLDTKILGDIAVDNIAVSTCAVAPGTRASSSSLTCTSPPGVGMVDLVITMDRAPLMTSDNTFEYISCDAPTCSACLETASFCRWCPETASCGATCAIGLEVDECPVAFSVVPLLDSGGGVEVTVTGSLFDPDASEPFHCNFDLSRTVATVVSSTELRCPSSAGTDADVFFVEHPNGTNYFGTYTNSFLHYTCATVLGPLCGQCLDGSGSGPLCGQCLDGSGSCNYCFEDQSCGTSVTCASNLTYTSFCPTVLTLSPALVNALIPTTVNLLIGLAAPIGAPLRCRFDDLPSAPTAPATLASATTAQCLTPALTFASTTTITLEYDTGIAWRTMTDPSQALELYVCNASTCGDCLVLGTGCGWCSQSNACVRTGNCPSNFIPGTGTCPFVLSTTPDPIESVIVGGTAVTFTYNDVPDLPGYTCEWTQGLAITTTPATRLSSTEVRCISVAQTGTTASVRMLRAGALYSGDVLPVSFYECSSFTSCSVCTSDDSPRACRWCARSAICGVCTGDSSLAMGDACPITIYSPSSPSSGTTAGGTEITLQGTRGFSSTALYYCLANGEVWPARFVNIATVACTSAPSTVAGEVEVLLMATNAYAEPVTFVYYDCGVYDSCATCSEASLGGLSQCGWCAETRTCGAASQCSGSFSSTCDTLVNLVGKDAGSTSGGSVLTLQATRFIEGSGYTCVFDELVQVDATWVSNTTIQCTTPPHADGLATITVLDGNVTNVEKNLLFIYYDCAELSTCESCVGSGFYDECGYCLSENTCRSSVECTIGFSKQCPKVDRVSPARGHADGQTVVSITGVHFAWDSGTPTLRCSFNGNYSGITTVVSDALITCSSPPGIPSDATLAIEGANGRPYVSDTELFTYYACPAVSTCEECVLPETAECGFCDGACLSSLTCPVAPCPALLLAEEETSSTTTVAVVTSLTVVICCLVVVVVVVLVVNRRMKQDEETFEAPVLTKKQLQDLLYTRTGASAPVNHAAVMTPELEKFRGQLVDRDDMTVALELVDGLSVAEYQDAARALAVVFASSTTPVPLMCALATKEIEESLSQATLFRTNSFTTKFWAEYTHVSGLQFTRDSLAVAINKSLKEAANTEVDERRMEGGDESLNKWTLLAACQRILVDILKSNPPDDIRCFLAHVAGQINKKYSYTAAGLGESVNNEYQGKVMAARELVTTQQDNLTALGVRLDPAFTDAARVTVEMLGDAVTDMHSEIVGLLESFDDIQAAADPTSKAAQGVLKKHAESINAVAVGGFYFLRWIVSVLSNTPYWAISQEEPGDEARRTLLLISKVLMNLSNNREFGKKEAYMRKMNEFITSNQRKINDYYTGIVAHAPAVQDLSSDARADVDVPAGVLAGEVEFLHNIYKNC